MICFCFIRDTWHSHLDSYIDILCFLSNSSSKLIMCIKHLCGVDFPLFCRFNLLKNFVANLHILIILLID